MRRERVLFHRLTLHTVSVRVVRYFVGHYPESDVDAWFIRRRKIGCFQILDAPLGTKFMKIHPAVPVLFLGFSFSFAVPPIIPRPSPGTSR